MFAYAADATRGHGQHPAMSAIDRLDLVVTSLARSLDFYRGLLEPLGYVRLGEIDGLTSRWIPGARCAQSPASSAAV